MPGKKGTYDIKQDVSISQDEAPSFSCLDDQAGLITNRPPEGSVECEDDIGMRCSSDEAIRVDDDQSLDAIALDDVVVQELSYHSADPGETDECNADQISVKNQLATSIKDSEVSITDGKKATQAQPTSRRPKCCFKTNERMMLTIGGIVVLCFIIIVIIVATATKNCPMPSKETVTAAHSMTVSAYRIIHENRISATSESSVATDDDEPTMSSVTESVIAPSEKSSEVTTVKDQEKKTKG